MPDSYEEIEARIQAALSSIPSGQKPNIAKLARDYAVPEQQLRARYKRRKDRSNCGGAGCSLTDDQELALCHIIKQEEAAETHLHH